MKGAILGTEHEIIPPSSSINEARIARAQAENARAEADKSAAEASKAAAEVSKAQADAARAQAEAASAREWRKAKNDEERREVGRAAAGVFSRLPRIGKIAVFVVPILIVVVVWQVVLPLATSKSETKYFGESELKAAVNIESLSTVDYAYTGIAEKSGKWLWMDSVAYRVKYKAYVSATINMSAIEFKVDDENKIVTAYLPEATVGTPVLASDSFDYLPKDPGVNISEVIELCKEDAANDVDSGEIKRKANENLQSTVKALTMSLLGNDGWKLKFSTLAEYQEENASAESNETAADESKAGNEGTGAEAGNEGK